MIVFSGVIVMGVVVIGTGRVGLVAACRLANSGHRVTGVEINQAKLNFLSHTSSPIHEKGIQAMLEQELTSGRLTFVPNLSDPLTADVAMITVNTQHRQTGKPTFQTFMPLWRRYERRPTIQ